MLEHPRLGIGAIEERDIGERNALAPERPDLVHDERRLVRVGGRLVQTQRLTGAFRGPQVLAVARAVLPDQRVGGIEDVAVRAVVLFELDDALDAEVALELLHVGGMRAAEGIDRLVVVADREHRVAAAGEQPQPLVLKPVGVLELVDQDVPKARAVVLAQNLVSARAARTTAAVARRNPPHPRGDRDPRRPRRAPPACGQNRRRPRPPPAAGLRPCCR